MLWEPDPTCDHEENDDCEHFAIWVATRVTGETLARGTMVLELREVNDDDLEDFDEVTVSSGIAVAYALETGTVTPLGMEGAIFLRHHPWLVEALRAELGFFGRRAARAAAQRDRETAAKKELGLFARTMVAYHQLFPADWDLVAIHDGERYWAVDLYCRNANCACSSSVINFYRMDAGEPRLVGEVGVDYAERDIEFQPSNDSVDAIFDTLWSACEYKLRARHSRAHDAVQRFAPRAAPAPAPAPTRAAPTPRLTASLERIPRNAACSCGSGKKYKRCCLDAPRLARSGA